MKHLLYAGLALAAVGLGYLTANWLQQDTATGPEPAPAFTLVDLEQNTHRKADYQGRLLLLNFWASWCAPCLKEMPLLNATYRQHRDAGLAILGPAIDDAEQARSFATKLEVAYPVVAGGESLFDLMDALGDDLGALPFTVLINRDGDIVERHWGQLTQKLLDQWLQQHL